MNERELQQSLSVIRMDNSVSRGRDGGQEIHVADCQVWAEIHYLDSCTSFREYLPSNPQRSQLLRQRDCIVLLDDVRSHSLVGSFTVFILASLTALLLVVAVAIYLLVA
jgi:hypothetical protein